jgi:hypothetical protein
VLTPRNYQWPRLSWGHWLFKATRPFRSNSTRRRYSAVSTLQTSGTADKA